MAQLSAVEYKGSDGADVTCKPQNGCYQPDAGDLWGCYDESLLCWADCIDETNINACWAVNEDVLVPQGLNRFYKLLHVLAGDVIPAPAGKDRDYTMTDLRCILAPACR